MGPKQPDLFGYGPGVRPTDPETSHLAARRTPYLRGADRVRCLIAHSMNPAGLTDYELAEIVNRQQNSAGKRRTELRDDGLVEPVLLPDGTFLKRKGPTGALCMVWRITALGKHLMAG